MTLTYPRIYLAEVSRADSSEEDPGFWDATSMSDAVAVMRERA
jgi:hypothetical protein